MADEEVVLDKVATDVLNLVQEGVRERLTRPHDQTIDTKWLSPHTLMLTVKRVGSNRYFNVVVYEVNMERNRDEHRVVL